MQLPTNLFDFLILIKKIEEKYDIELTVSKKSIKYLINNNIKTIIKDIKKEKQTCNL